MNIHSIKVKPLIISIAVPFIAALFSVLISGGMQGAYDVINKPVISPPAWVFPVVWSILYLLMGISCCIIYVAKSNLRGQALYFYALQLIINALWPFIFFRLRMYLFAFIWLCLLIMAVFLMYIYFRKIDKLSARLQIPYFIWLIFAGILNACVYFLN